jgi:2-polyprenyl-3-methyl-5-hydroxy-6-metoxy-1,4-benzoquinol methylase
MTAALYLFFGVASIRCGSLLRIAPVVIDPAITWLARAVAGRAGPPLVVRKLIGLRRQVTDELVTRFRPQALGLSEAIHGGNATARQELVALGERALGEHRREVEQRARGLQRWTAAVDRLWTSTAAAEYLDDPGFDLQKRVRLIDHLDLANELLLNYEAFVEQIQPGLARERPTRILDLAAGHAGFMCHLARRAAAEGWAVDLTASDLKLEYLELGRKRAASEKLPLQFIAQDALDLSNHAPGSYDIVLCTQALHHFPPGLITVMFAEAMRLAARGVFFIDGCRDLGNALAIALLGALRFADLPFVHDAWISFRRFFVPEELELLARITQPHAGVRASWIRPGHSCLHGTPPATSNGVGRSSLPRRRSASRGS